MANTASGDNYVRLWESEGGQWREKVILDGPCVWVMVETSFSPDGKYLVIASNNNLAKLWERVDVQSEENVTQQWQEKLTIQYDDVVNYVHFSSDGKHFVTASDDKTAKIFGLVGGNWQVKATIRHSGPVTNANFSRNGKLLVTASCDGTAKICGLVGGKWQVKATIRQTKAWTNAIFGPDYQIVTASSDNPAKIWMLKNKENDGNSWIRNKLLKKLKIKKK